MRGRAKLVTHDGLEMSQAAWAERLGITPQGLGKRLRSMPVAEALAATRAERERLWKRNMRRAKAGKAHHGTQLSNQ